MRKEPNFRSSYATAYTRTGKLDMTNRKPYRTSRQRAEARENARIVEGRHVSSAPVSHHPVHRQVRHA